MTDLPVYPEYAGYARSDFRQACAEMTALFRGQSAIGMMPQIVFSVENVGKYFPGYFFWKKQGVPGKPRNKRTSGITMPPVHGFILNRLLQLAPDTRAARPFFRRMFDRVLLLQRYYYEYRDPNAKVWRSFAIPGNRAWTTCRLGKRFLPIYNSILRRSRLTSALIWNMWTRLTAMAILFRC